jgi:hypothetical protein
VNQLLQGPANAVGSGTAKRKLLTESGAPAGYAGATGSGIVTMLPHDGTTGGQQDTWKAFSDCKQPTLLALKCEGRGDDCTIEAGAGHVAQMVPEFAGVSKGGAGGDMRLPLFYARLTPPTECELPKYTKDNQGGYVLSNRKTACRPATCVGTPTSLSIAQPSDACEPICRGGVNRCDSHAGGSYSCHKYCVRKLSLTTASASQSSGCVDISQIHAQVQPVDADSKQSRIVWPATIAKSVACSFMCLSAKGLPTPCTSDLASRKPTWKCDSWKKATLYNCAAKCEGYGEVCNKAVQEYNDADCQKKIGECLRAQKCEVISTHSYANTPKGTCQLVAQVQHQFSMKVSIE